MVILFLDHYVNDEEYKKWGLEVNIMKTESMCIGGTYIVLEDRPIMQLCQDYKYLDI